MATTYDGTTVNFDSTDWKGMIDLMDHSDQFDSVCEGENSEGEKVLISINKDNITVQTFQDNGWMRENIYYRDCTVEELFHR